MQGVKFVYRHFPLTIHKNSTVGARAVEAARQLGKPWEMIDLLFDKQDDWANETNPETKFVGYAKSLGLSDSDFLKAYKSDSSAATVSADLALGDRLQLSGTP
jgi:protein-disulfide isomerase